jgi:predicted metal-dependent TIM-barrel fold hydrolase
VTDTLLEVLEDYLPWQDRILVDHCTPRTIGRVLIKGFWAGVTLSPIKCSMDDLLQIVQKQKGQLERVVLNTDSGSSYYEDLIRAAHHRSLPEEVRCALVQGNAGRFYDIGLGLHGYSKISINLR